MIHLMKLPKELTNLCIGLGIILIGFTSCGLVATDPNSLVDQGVEHIKKGEIEEADMLFERAIQIDSTHIDARYYLAEVSFENDRYERAIRLLNDIIRLEGESTRVLYLKGRSKISLADRIGGISEFTKAINIDSTFAPAIYLRGEAYGDDTGQWNLAIKDFNRAIEIDSTNPEYYWSRGNHTVQKEKAIADFSRAVDLDPEYTSAYVNRAFLRMKISDRTGACEDFSKAAEYGHPFGYDYIQQYCR
jgi:tetratricopeptide (TPR) repeat protein